MKTSNTKKKTLFVAVSVVLLIALSVATVYAYLRTNLGAVTNSFSAASDPSIAVSETFSENVKTDVAVDVGNPRYAVYVRAAIVVTWENDDGEVLATKPVAETDYTIELNTDKWFEKDGFYYYREPIGEGTTAPLIKELQKIASAPESGYKLHVQILSQTVQALGETDDTSAIPAVTDAWGIEVSDGKLVENSDS